MQRLSMRWPASFRPPAIFALLALVLFSWADVSSAIAQPVSGFVRSGNTAIPGATVRVYSAGYDRGIPPSILGSAVTDASGRFSVSFPPSPAGSVLYVTAKGPRPTTDLAAMLPAHQANIVVNELSTIATAWAMAQFMSGDNIGGKSPGLQNAAATAGNLVNVYSGTIAGVLATPGVGLPHPNML
jgi:hypothetical protein